jgi:phospholipase A1
MSASPGACSCRDRLAAALVTLLCAWVPHAIAQSAGQCVSIDDDAQRLRCYDAAAGRTPATIAAAVRSPDPEAAAPPTSIWEQRIRDDATREVFTLTSYRPTYILYTWASSPNQAPYRVFGIENPLRHGEAKLNLSLQTKVADDVVGANGDLWFAYTQTAYWQVGNETISSPFRETNHEPEAYASFLTDYRLGRFKLRAVNVGVVHQSNGQAGSLSRSWNRVFAEFQLVAGAVSLSVKPWIRIRTSPDKDDNPDIEDYLGHYELRAAYERSGHLYRILLRNVFDREGRYNAEVAWSFPIAGRLRGLVQWYNGYGESLIDYNYKQNRFGIGVLMSDWL